MFGIIFGVFVCLTLLLFYWANSTSEIYKINKILNKDRTVCDFIEGIDGWSITFFPCDAIRLVITPPNMDKYYLYLSYRGKKPDESKLKELYHLLTNDKSPVYLAHQKGLPYEWYINSLRG